MEPINNINEFYSMLKYAYELKLTGPRSAEEVPTVGIAFGNYKIPSRCHEYMNRSYNGHNIKVHITAGHIIAKVELVEISTGNNVFSAELNYDKNELLDFKEKTPVDSSVVLIFGFKHGCDYYIPGKSSDKSQDFLPMVLAGYDINIL